MNSLSAQRLRTAITTVVGLMVSACATSHKRVVPTAEVRPALEATKDELVARYNEQARAVHSLNAAVELAPVAGSRYTGVIEEYHKVKGFILAARPANIRVIGQAPVVAKNIFDMASNGTTFHIFIPSKNKFLVGSAQLERPAKKPIENLRPQHLIDAIFWPEIGASEPVLLEEFDEANERDYILTLLQKMQGAPEIARRIWFDRTDLSVTRVQIYGPGGRLLSDIRYADWQTADGAGFPKTITLRRPHDDYQLGITITRLKVNEEIGPERFRLEQPAGAELVRVGEGQSEAPQ